MRKLDEGTFKGPIVPIGFKEPEARMPKHEAGAMPTSSLRPMDEPPESPAAMAVAEAVVEDAVAAEELPAMPGATAVLRKIGEATVRIETKGYIKFEDEFEAVATVDDLRPQDKDYFLRVRDHGNVGICSRCNWTHGCNKCDEAKAWTYCCRATLWAKAAESMRPMAKPRGRPKRAGK